MQRNRVSSASPYEIKYGFSRAVRHGNQISVAGTAPIGPDDETFAPGDAFRQAERCFEIIIRAVEELGGKVGDIVRTRMYIVDPSDADAVGRAHGAMFGEIRPAATMVVVKELLSVDWRVEIEADAVIG